MKIKGSPLLTLTFIVLLVFAIFFIEDFVSSHKRLDLQLKPNSEKTSLNDNDKQFVLEHLNLKTKTATKVRLKDYLGKKKLLINFWATWCPPCLDELPSLEYLNRLIKEKSLPIQILTLSADDHEKAIYALSSTLTFSTGLEVLLNKKGDWIRTWGTSKFPETFLISPEGKILFKWVGPQDWTHPDLIRKLIES